MNSNTTDGLLLARNLDDVFNERDSDRRMQAIKALYAEDAVFYEGDEKFEGWAAIAKRFDDILVPTPSEFRFSIVKTPGRIHDLEQLQWQLGPVQGTSVASGLDVGQVSEGKIQSLYTFVDPS
jgi:hypothetical protein